MKEMSSSHIEENLNAVDNSKKFCGFFPEEDLLESAIKNSLSFGGPELCIIPDSIPFQATLTTKHRPFNHMNMYHTKLLIYCRELFSDPV